MWAFVFLKLVEHLETKIEQILSDAKYFKRLTSSNELSKKQLFHACL